jgi:hypothetical protein
MFVGGGAVKGFIPGAPGDPPVRSGVFNCHPSDPVPWVPGTSSASTMFGVENSYLKRAVDYRSVLGEIIREHLGATQAQLDRIIRGYATESDPNLSKREHLQFGGTVGPPLEKDLAHATQIRGELDIV